VTSLKSLFNSVNIFPLRPVVTVSDPVPLSTSSFKVAFVPIFFSYFLLMIHIEIENVDIHLFKNWTRLSKKFLARRVLLSSNVTNFFYIYCCEIVSINCHTHTPHAHSALERVCTVIFMISLHELNVMCRPFAPVFLQVKPPPRQCQSGHKWLLWLLRSLQSRSLAFAASSLWFLKTGKKSLVNRAYFMYNISALTLSSDLLNVNIILSDVSFCQFPLLPGSVARLGLPR
jgi:hypothetical protein